MKNKDMGKKEMMHTFAICAYKESPFLEECIQSILKQNVKSEVLIATSTPNAYIEDLAKKYDIPLYINTGEKGITQDWNFAYSKADTELITIAHQDDVYLPHYTQDIIEMIKEADKPLIAFSDYGELRDGVPVELNKLLRVKRMLLFPLGFKVFQKSKFARRRSLSLGNAICCPAVTFVKKNVPNPVFQHGFRSNEDWEAWEVISRLDGEFLYSKKVAMYHRIHEGSETSKIIGDNARTTEDLAMFRKFWPEPIAKFIAKIYASSEGSNNL